MPADTTHHSSSGGKLHRDAGKGLSLLASARCTTGWPHRGEVFSGLPLASPAVCVASWSGESMQAGGKSVQEGSEGCSRRLWGRDR